MNSEKKCIKEFLTKFHGNKPLFYLKFTKEREWAQDISDGKLFMNNSNLYRKIEAATGIKGQGDSDELKLKLSDVTGYIVLDENNTKFPFHSPLIKMENDNDKYMPMFCLTVLTIDNFDIVEFNKIFNQNQEILEVTLKCSFTTEELNKMKEEFGKYIVIFANNFDKVLGSFLDELGEEYQLDIVRYTKNNDMDRTKAFSANNLDRFFYKDLDFEYQKEIRLVINRIVHDNMTLTVDSLKDISYMTNADNLKEFIVKLKYHN